MPHRQSNHAALVRGNHMVLPARVRHIRAEALQQRIRHAGEEAASTRLQATNKLPNLNHDSILGLHGDKPYRQIQHPSNAATTHRLMNNPHTSAYKLRPYVATMFRKIRRLGDMSNVANVKVFPITNTQPTSMVSRFNPWKHSCPSQITHHRQNQVPINPTVAGIP